MKVTWQVEDGYAGGARPHWLTVPDDELEGLSEAQQEDVIESYVEHAFNDQIGWSWTKD